MMGDYSWVLHGNNQDSSQKALGEVSRAFVKSMHHKVPNFLYLNNKIYIESNSLSQ